MLGLDADWAFKNAIAVSGNYGEVFEKNIGEDHTDRSGPWPERSVDRRRPDLQPPFPLNT